MARRKYNWTKRCNEDGCREVELYSFSTRRDYNSALERYNDEGWLCRKHDGKSGYLPPVECEKTGKLIIECVHPDKDKWPSIAHTHTWTTGSGHVNGVCDRALNWNADADEFPIGSKIIIETTVTVVLPGDEDG